MLLLITIGRGAVRSLGAPISRCSSSIRWLLLGRKRVIGASSIRDRASSILGGSGGAIGHFDRKGKVGWGGFKYYTKKKPCQPSVARGVGRIDE